MVFVITQIKTKINEEVTNKMNGGSYTTRTEFWGVMDFVQSQVSFRPLLALFLLLFIIIIWCHLYSTFSIVQCSNALYRG